MNKNIDFEKKVKKLLKSPADLSLLTENNNDYQSKQNWLNAICLSLITKAAKGDIQAIKYISEICKQPQDQPLAPVPEIVIKVVE